MQSWMGHKDFKTTKMYYDMHEGMPDLTAAADVSRAIWGNVGTRVDTCGHFFGGIKQPGNA